MNFILITMKKVMKALAAIMLIAAVACIAGCTKPDEPNDEPNNNQSNYPEGPFEAPVGGVNALFAVSPTQQVFISQGNLQYQASTHTWRFAENQWNFVGSTVTADNSSPSGNVAGSSNHNISSTYEGWIDLFGWGTSGYNNTYMPYTTSYYDEDFVSVTSLTGEYANYDWGVYNPISNGGNQAGMWRTMTKDEWKYLIDTRNTTSGTRYAKAIVHGVKGLMLFPDYWDSTVFELEGKNDGAAAFTINVVSLDKWQNVIEPSGVVFLPAAGNRIGTGINSIGQDVNSSGGAGYYTSATKTYIYDVSGVYFGSYNVTPTMGAGEYFRGLSVRLVHDAY
jgi:hypothetical protein